MDIGILVGSLRKDSYNRKLALTIKDLAPDNVAMEIIPIDNLPFFNQDLEEDPPPAWVDFRKKIHTKDGFLLVTPEYNRSVPAVLKNALDVGSRPYGQNVWDGKPCAVISASLGTTGGFGANHHIRQALVFLNMPCMQQPEVYLAAVNKLFDAEGKLPADTMAFLKKFVQAYEQWVFLHSNKA